MSFRGIVLGIFKKSALWVGELFGEKERSQGEENFKNQELPWRVETRGSGKLAREKTRRGGEGRLLQTTADLL